MKKHAHTQCRNVHFVQPDCFNKFHHNHLLVWVHNKISYLWGQTELSKRRLFTFVNPDQWGQMAIATHQWGIHFTVQLTRGTETEIAKRLYAQNVSMPNCLYAQMPLYPTVFKPKYPYAQLMLCPNVSMLRWRSEHLTSGLTVQHIIQWMLDHCVSTYRIKATLMSGHARCNDCAL